MSTRTKTEWAILGLLTLTIAAVSAQGFEFLPREVQERIGEVEEAREAWEARRAEVINQIRIQPWEEEEEFARRVERAVARGAGREFRFLQFQANELAQHTFSVSNRHITLLPEERREHERRWTVTVRTDLGFLPMTDTFVVSIPPEDQFDLARAIENDALEGRMNFTVSGTVEGSYRITLDRLFLSDSSRPGPSFRTASVNRHYAFSRYEPLAVVQPGIRITFEDGQMPEEFTTFGEAPWTVVRDSVFAGDYSLRAGEIFDSMHSEIRYNAPVPAGAALARVTFAVRTSSEQRYDFLGFYVDGTQYDTWSGIGDWVPVSYEVDVVARDSIELIWRYEKDASVSQGEDTAWIDDVRIDFE